MQYVKYNVMLSEDDCTLTDSLVSIIPNKNISKICGKMDFIKVLVLFLYLLSLLDPPILAIVAIL